MKLADMKEGDRARIVHVNGEEAVKRHLGALGFVAGTVVRVVRTSYGNMILAVHESRIAVNDATAADIEVDEV
jgi:ferrous iron transport protein A